MEKSSRSFGELVRATAMVASVLAQLFAIGIAVGWMLGTGKAFEQTVIIMLLCLVCIVGIRLEVK